MDAHCARLATMEIFEGDLCLPAHMMMMSKSNSYICFDFSAHGTPLHLPFRALTNKSLYTLVMLKIVRYVQIFIRFEKCFHLYFISYQICTYLHVTTFCFFYKHFVKTSFHLIIQNSQDFA